MNNIRTLPSYHLIVCPDGSKFIGFRDWADMFFDESSLVVKPIYTTIPQEGSIQRKIRGEVYYDLKSKRFAGRWGVLTEAEILKACNCPSEWICNMMPFTLVRVPRRQQMFEWRPSPELNEATCLCEKGLIEFVQSMPTADLDFAPLPFLIGSRLYAPSSTSDIDIAITCAPEFCLRLRRSIAYRRVQANYSKTSSEYLEFAFKIKIENQTVDIFPCPPAGTHPLANIRSWKISETRQYTGRVMDVSMGSFSLPSILMDTAPSLVVIGSNAFRGAFAYGETLSFSATYVIAEKEGSVVEFLLVSNPWHDLDKAMHYFSPSRDKLWLS